MKALADYVHSKGLKLGIYSSPGLKSCAGFPGSYGHIRQDARTWAAWGIDYVKYDLCSGEAFYHTPYDVQAVYQQMGEALQATDRPIVYSLCEYGRFDVGSWGRKVGGNLWRTTRDISDTYDSMATIGFGANADPKYAGPGGWNDLDMLEVGNGGMTDDEYRTHLTLWAMRAAPLLTGNDLRSMTPATVAVLTNKGVIAVDQDRLGEAGHKVSGDDKGEIWTRNLADGSMAVALFNRTAAPDEMAVQWSEMGVPGGAKARDLWAEHDLGQVGDAYSTTVPAHGVVLLRVGG
jgi:alpha-galactosidase